jgi:hypothetical protein
VNEQVAAEFSIELDRVVDRLRTMPITKLERAANLTRPVLSELAEMAGQLRPVPKIADRALGDQCAVLGQELIDSGRPRAAAAVLLRELRLTLP